MVSNYVEKGVVDHPIRKKYTRDQIASLMYIAVSKTVLSIENIDTLFKMQREHCSAGTAYDIFCEELEASLSVVFGSKAAQPETVLNDERLLLRSTIFCGGQQNVSGLLLRCLAAGAGSVVGYPAGSGVTVQNNIAGTKNHPETQVFGWFLLADRLNHIRCQIILQMREQTQF